MFKNGRLQYCIKSCSSEDPIQLENLLNSMSNEGWEVYTIQETENDEGYCYNCIFVKDNSNSEFSEEDFSQISGFKSQMEKLIAAQNEPFQLCKDIQLKIKDKRSRINQIKSLLDSVSDYEKKTLNDELEDSIKELGQLKTSLMRVISPDNMLKEIGAEKVTIGLSVELIDIVNPDLGADMIAQMVKLRKQMVEELGYIIPHVKFYEDENLAPYEFVINVRSVPALKGVAYPSHIMFYKDDLSLTKMPANSIKGEDVLTGRKIVWIEKDKAADFWTKGSDVTEVIAQNLKFIIIKYIEEIFDYMDTNHYIEIVADKNMFLVENIIPDFISVSELKYLLSQLIKEHVSIKDILYIFEKFNDFSDDMSKEDILNRIRIALSRQISQSLANENGIINAFSLAPATVSSLYKFIEIEDDIIKIDGAKLNKLVKNIKKTIQKSENTSQKTILVVPKELRHILSSILSQMMHSITVISKEEVSNEFSLEITELI